MLTKKRVLAVFTLALLLLTGRVFLYFENKQTSGFIQTQGQILDSPYLKKDRLYFRIGHYRVSSEYLNLNFGDKVAVAGKLDEGVIEAEKVEVIASKGIEKNLTNLRISLNSEIQKNLPSPQSQLLSGIVLGIKSNLSKDFRDELVNTGTLHVVVVSGYNIALVAGLALSFSFFLGRKKASLLAAVLVVGYTFLVGFSAPTLRAAIMATLTILATLLGKRAIAAYFLFVTAYILVMFVPENLIDISFQLTFLATLGLIIFTRPINALLKRVIKPIREPLTTTLAAQVLVVPLIFFYFGNVSLISPLVNILVLWTIPMATIGGFAYILFLYLNPLLASLIGYLLLVPLTIFTELVIFFGRFSFFVIKVESGNALVVVGYLLIVLAVSLEIIKRVYVLKASAK